MGTQAPTDNNSYAPNNNLVATKLMEGPNDASVHNEIEETVDEATLLLGERLAHQSITHSLHRISKVDALVGPYEPIIVSVGPYHHGKAHLLKMEHKKLCYLRFFMNRKNETPLNLYVKAMRELEERTRLFYEDPITLNTNDFVLMMLLDGCFILGLFLDFDGKEKYESQETTSDINQDYLIKKRDKILPSIRRDLLLCENQLPYFVFSKLLELIALPEDEKRFDVLAMKFFSPVLKGREPILIRDENYISFNHILCMMHYHRCPRPIREVSVVIHENESVPDCWTSKFSALELQEAGITFNPIKNATSPFEVKFNNGTLEIAPLIINPHTESLFRNLIAFENRHMPFEFDYIIDYVRFMDNLINRVEDVQILRQSGIIQNLLGDDEAICTMFNSLCGNVVFANRSSCYLEVINKIEAHCKKRCNSWMANLRHKYFNSPWAIIKFCAAVFALNLGAIQALYAFLSYTQRQ